MTKRKTHEEFIKQVFELVGEEYLVSNEYKNALTKLQFNHVKCGNNFFMAPHEFLKGQRCPTCSMKKVGQKNKKTDKQFMSEVYRLVGNEYEFLKKYIDAETKIPVKHNKCGYIWDIAPVSFVKTGTRCPKCAIKNRSNKRRKTNEIFIKEIFDLVGNEYSVLGQYKNSHTKISMRHNLCGNEFLMPPSDFISKGCRCPECKQIRFKKAKTKTHKRFIEEVNSLFKDEYFVLSQYHKNKEPIYIVHTRCNKVFKTIPSSFLRGHGCPFCNESHGENTIGKYLRKNHIKFRSQYKIKECKNIRSLPFDFALFDKNKLISLVEFDGRQHTEIIEFFGGEKGLKKRQHNDSIKTNYCLAHNIPLIRISHKVKNIEEYLENELKKLNIKIQLSIL